MRIDVVERPAVRVAYLRYTGPFGDPLGRFWRSTVAPWLADHGLVDCPRYGVTLDNPMSTPPFPGTAVNDPARSSVCRM